MTTLAEAQEIVRSAMAASGVQCEVEARPFPSETIFLVLVSPEQYDAALEISGEIDKRLNKERFAGFVTVRKQDSGSVTASRKALKAGVHDSRVLELQRLLATRSRTSETTPSLQYVKDVAANLSAIVADRHHLIFGRRGAGKTSLLVEAKRKLTASDEVTAWVNVQTLRWEGSVDRIFVWIIRSLADALAAYLRTHPEKGSLTTVLGRLSTSIDDLLSMPDLKPNDANRLIPSVQRLLAQFSESSGKRVFLFLDDFHYLPRREQPRVLDMLHACVRDTQTWLKVAAIRNMSRWFQADPPMGLQTGHDADHLDLDVTLETPQRAKEFLETVLKSFAAHVGIPGLSGVFNPWALDRLVLAAGGVPRDYLVVAAESIRSARTRSNAKVVGVQDVNRAAGTRAKVKIQELEEDAAAAESAARALDSLQIIRGFCIEEQQCTFFRVDFKDKERHIAEYELLSELLDGRLVHLINPSVSDKHRAGERSEAMMLDLSQFSGQRLRKKLQVLDLRNGQLVLRQTGHRGIDKIGDTPKKLVDLMRVGPQFELDRLSEAECAK